jgi:hypothetical protein
MLYKRIDQGKQYNPQWVGFVYQIMLMYNTKMVHSSLNMTPTEATKPSHAMNVNSHVQLQATFTINYPALSKGNSVKLYKKKTLGHKERVISFNQNSYTTHDITENMVRCIKKWKAMTDQI